MNKILILISQFENLKSNTSIIMRIIQSFFLLNIISAHTHSLNTCLVINIGINIINI